MRDRRAEHNELTRPHKSNSLDTIEAWAMTDSTDEYIRARNAYGDSTETRYIPVHHHSTKMPGAIKNTALIRHVESLCKEIEALDKTMSENGFKLEFNRYNGWMTVSVSGTKTFNLDYQTYHDYLERKEYMQIENPEEELDRAYSFYQLYKNCHPDVYAPFLNKLRAFKKYYPKLAQKYSDLEENL